MLPFTGIILAGGKSARMGSEKGLLEIDGVSFVSRIISALKSANAHRIILNTNNTEAYKNFDVVLCPDFHHGSLGPLAGIYAALEKSETEDNVVVPCDSPFVSSQIIQLLTALNSDSLITFFHWKGRSHPLIGAYKKSASSLISNLLDHDIRKANYLCQLPEVKVIDLKSLNLFCEHDLDIVFENINTMEDFSKFEFHKMNTSLYIEKEMSIVLFGMIAERLGKSKMRLPLRMPVGGHAVSYFRGIFPELEHLPFQVAFDMELSENIPELDFFEIALLPPFAGG